MLSRDAQVFPRWREAGCRAARTRCVSYELRLVGTHWGGGSDSAGTHMLHLLPSAAPYISAPVKNSACFVSPPAFVTA